MQVISFERAADLIHDGDTILIGGSGGGHAVPEALIAAVESRFLQTGSPQQLTTLHPVGLGDMDTQGVGRLAHPGLLKRVICGALVNTPAIQKMAFDDAIEAYTLPQGALSQLMREMAAGRPGLISHVGLHTFVDPRHGGGRQSRSAQHDLVELVTLAGQEWLFFKPIHVDVAFLRGTTADEDGNISMEKEAVFGEMLSMAQATRRAGGIVIAQVQRLAQRHSLPPKNVKIPGMLVDLVVVDPDQRQSYTTDFSPSFAGELRVPLDEIPSLPFGARKIIARRAAMELFPGAICNLGAGVSTGIANIAAEEGFLDQIVLSNEQGLIGGAPASGVDAGAAMNYDAMIDQPYQFDFYDGGGLDLAFLSFAQVDAEGSVNVSRFGKRIIGVGGFQHIAQNAKPVLFSGTFTAGGLKMSWRDGQTAIEQEGRFPKFVQQLEQVSYNGVYAASLRQNVLFVTERAVFRRTEEGLTLVEIAPGVDLEGDVLAHVGFSPSISPDLKTMDDRLFDPQPMDYAPDLLAKPRLNLPARLKQTR
ncbi:MAG: 3-oxoacid CoA-transferase [Chloroflexi bacterium]|nr:3-oxoacid CoA-transferase [Chloroflexota bacterium]